MLTYSGRTDGSGELCYDYSISNDLIHLLTFLLGSQTLILTVLLFWRYLFLLTLVFLKLGPGEFWGNASNVFNNVNLLYLFYSKARKCCLLHLIKQNCLLKTFLRILILIIQVYISLHVFPSRTNLKLHNISVTPKMVKKVITNLELLKASGPDCVAAVALKNFESELLYIPAQLINKCLKESCFWYCWKVSLVVPVFKSVAERSTI